MGDIKKSKIKAFTPAKNIGFSWCFASKEKKDNKKVLFQALLINS